MLNVYVLIRTLFCVASLFKALENILAREHTLTVYTFALDLECTCSLTRATQYTVRGVLLLECVLSLEQIYSSRSSSVPEGIHALLLRHLRRLC